MIWTLIRVGLTNLRRDRVAQAMTFVLPIVFFSIFATVFGGRSGGTAKINIALVDEDHSEFSQRVAAGLVKEGSLQVQTAAGPKEGGGSLTRAAAETLVKNGDRFAGPALLPLPEAKKHRPFVPQTRM